MNELTLVGCFVFLVYFIGLLMTFLVCCAVAWTLTDGKDIVIKWSRKRYSNAVVGSVLKPKQSFIQMIKEGVV